MPPASARRRQGPGQPSLRRPPGPGRHRRQRADPGQPGHPAATAQPPHQPAHGRGRCQHLHGHQGRHRAALRLLAPRPGTHGPPHGSSSRQARPPAERQLLPSPGQTTRRRPVRRRTAHRSRYDPGQPGSGRHRGPACPNPQGGKPQQVLLGTCSRPAPFRMLGGTARRRRAGHARLPANRRPEQPQGPVPGCRLPPRTHPRPLAPGLV